MSWFTDLAGRAENLLNNLDQQTGAALKNHNDKKPKNEYTIYQDGNWGQKSKRPQPRHCKKSIIPTESKSNYTPNGKQSLHRSAQQSQSGRDIERNGKKKSGRSKSPQYHLNNCPATMVDDVQGDCEIMECDSRSRRYSLPSNLDQVSIKGDMTMHFQNLEVENAMLKNELNVMNREVTELLDRLRHSEEGNDVDRFKELSKTRLKLDDYELQNHRCALDKDSLSSQLDLLKTKIRDIMQVQKSYHGEKQSLVTENSLLKDTNTDLEEKIKELTKKAEDNNTAQYKLETDLRHAQTTISELQENLAKSNEECQRLERDWETYKLRVKSMLHAKDNELKSLQDGLNLSEDTKILVEQLECLKEERDELAEAITNVRAECNNMKHHLTQMEGRHSAAERVVAALRDAMRDERAARNRAESQAFAMSKELKNMQIETGQTIASLRTALRDKESELNHIRETASSIKSTDTSALNVADYDVTRDTIENEKIQYLTETLVQRQGRLDRLLAENNMLKIQMDKLESKLKVENMRTNSSHSIVNLQSGEHRSRRAHSESLVTLISRRMAVVIRRHPMLRIFVIIYMICLHFWVLTVLLTSTPPENIIPRTSKS